MGKRSPHFLLVQYALTFALTLFLTACSKNSSPTGAGTGGIITVTGKVIGINNQPVASVPVQIVGVPSVNTDANGAFTIANVTTPYTIIVVDGANNRALVYRGLTRSDPTLFWLGATPGTLHSAAVSGSLVAWTPIAPGTQTTARAGFVSPDASGNATVNNTSGNVTISSSWYGSTTTTGTIYALIWNYDSNILPTTFVKFGKRSNVTLLDGTTNSGQNDTIGVAQTAQISGTVNVPSGYTLKSRSVYAVFESKLGIPILSDGTTVPNFTYNTPNVTGAGASLVALAQDATGSVVESFMSGLGVNQTGITMTMPAAPEQSLPVDNATGVTTKTPFSWTQFQGGIHLVVFNAVTSGQPNILLITAATSDSIPNLSSLGLPLPSAATYHWSVDGVGPFSSMDAAAGSGGPLGFVTNTFAFTGSFANSTSRTFTTAP